MAEIIKTICPLYNEWQVVLPGVPYPGSPFIDLLGATIDTLDKIKYNPTTKAYSFDGGEWIIPGQIPTEEEVIKTEAETAKEKKPWEIDPDGWEFTDDPFGGVWKQKTAVTVGSDTKAIIENLIAAVLPGYHLIEK